MRLNAYLARAGIAYSALEGLSYTEFFPHATMSPEQSEILDGCAQRTGATPAQVVMAWLLARSPNLLLIPGTMEAGLDSILFWGSLAFALAIAGVVAVPVNRWLIARGKGHAVVHETGIHGGPSPRVVGAIAAAAGVFGTAVLLAELLS